MKKTGLLFLGPALLLGACTPTESSSNISNSSTTSANLSQESSLSDSSSTSSSIPRTDILEDYRNSFNASTTITSTMTGAADTMDTIDVYYGADYYTSVFHRKTSLDTIHFMEVKDGRIFEKKLDAYAEIIDIEKEAYAGSYLDNPLSFVETEILEDGDYPIADVEDCVRFAYLLSGGLTGSLVPKSVSFHRAGDRLSSTIAYLSVAGEITTTLTLETVFAPKAEEKTYRLDEAKETALSKQMDDLLLDLMDGNYTMEIREGDKTSLLYATADAIYLETEAEKKLYLATMDGTDVGIFNETDQVFYLNEQPEVALSTYLPDFDVDGRVFGEKDGSIYVLSYAEDVGTHFSLPIFEEEITDSSLCLSMTEEGLAYTNGSMTFAIKDIGSTLLPVEPEIIEISGWKSESQLVQDGIVALLGSLDALPYWDVGYAWETTYDPEYSSSYFDLECYDLPAEEVEAAINSYAQLLREEGYRTVTLEEYEGDLGFYAYDYTHALFFQLTDTVYIEVYDLYESWFGMMTGVGISVNSLE